MKIRSVKFFYLGSCLVSFVLASNELLHRTLTRTFPVGGVWERFDTIQAALPCCPTRRATSKVVFYTLPQGTIKYSSKPWYMSDMIQVTKTTFAWGYGNTSLGEVMTDLYCYMWHAITQWGKGGSWVGHFQRLSVFAFGTLQSNENCWYCERNNQWGMFISMTQCRETH